ncbi:MAG: hypothetical protein ACJ764_00910 [Solirubrobacteraceae bacterium]
MHINLKAGTVLTAAAALAIAVPAAAHPGHGNHSGGNGQSHSHRCSPHRAAYVERGTVDADTASTLADNGDGTWSGTLVVDVTRASHRARGDVGSTVTYTFESAPLRVRFAGGATGFTAGERVRLIGKIAVVRKRCAAPDPVPAPVFRMVGVHPARSDSGSGSSDSESGSAS